MSQNNLRDNNKNAVVHILDIPNNDTYQLTSTGNSTHMAWDRNDELYILKTNIENSTIDVAFPGTELHFQFNVDTRLDLYKNCSIYIDDGFKSQLFDKGSGIQSATIIGLFKFSPM